ncbi:hypothetical protein ACFQ4C_17810 [Larkinella insperata]|uniref:RadC-like JAB domain-containing protein n=1 Tax=Larkinella insperata TaxID=332158 RepID=A0ABW3QBN7_9BACT|nr:hypothetical protein [Larkinella insperata]
MTPAHHLLGRFSRFQFLELRRWLSIHQPVPTPHLVSVRAEEIERLARVVRQNTASGSLLALDARGTLGAHLLHAAVFEGSFYRLILLN